MKVFMIGGTGLLGSEGARELIRRGHSVTSISLPPLPSGALLPPEMVVDFGNYLELSDEELRAHLRGCEGLVFAAGVDERIEGPPPIYEMFSKYNIIPLRRLLAIAKECGVRHCVICGSYFAYFDRVWPQKQLAKHHPYIQSRVDQAALALSFADENFDVAVLELPYIFGVQPGRKPVWVFLVEQIRSMKLATLYPKGGTTMLTVRQVAQCIAGALERNRGGRNYPVGWYNLSWREMLTIVHRHLGIPHKKIITIPDWMFRLAGRGIVRKQQAAGHQGGLDMVAFSEVMCARTFIDKSTIEHELGVQPDDIDAAIGASIRLCVEVLDGKAQVIGMKAENPA
ncbi:MAG: NAD-dependent epimerase/dehydratase family protein [Spirochaetes bacterium]|nr:NAD-dependent epimerase/dehydratase family protein [Spirochaetota bacterium]